MSGYDVAQRIRDEQWGKDVVLVALTGWGREEDRRRSRDAGLISMVKPVDPDALMRFLASR
jgi:DNA-binding response OmpR family regulator